jgi:hypothetical protein
VEDEVLQVLRAARGAHLSVKEIGKAADRTRYREEPNWARSVLEQLVSRKTLEKDSDGRYFHAVDRAER